MAKLSPIFNDAQLDSDGAPYSGALLFTYAAGSSTKQTTYKDNGSVANHTNPIVLNSRGEPPAPIWLTAGLTYKFVFAPPGDTDPPTSPIRSPDNIEGVNDTTTTVDQWPASGLTPTYVSATSFTVVGDQTSVLEPGRRIKTTNSGGTIYSVIKSSAYTTLTTVTVVNDSGTLDAGLSALNLSILRADNSAVPILSDTFFLISGSADKTKKMRFEVDGLTTDTTRTMTVPDSNLTLVGTTSKAAAKAWVTFDGTAGTPTPANSYNVSSITDNGTGDYTINFTTAFSSVNYCAFVETKYIQGTEARQGGIHTKGVGSVRIQTATGDGSGLEDSSEISVVCFGDQ